MARQLGAGIETHQRGAALGLAVVPDRFLADSGDRIDPSDLAEVEILRWRRAGGVSRRLDATAQNRQYRRAVLARDAVDASVRTVADVAAGGGPVFVGDCAFDNVEQHGTTTSGNVGYRPNGCVH